MRRSEVDSDKNALQFPLSLHMNFDNHIGVLVSDYMNVARSSVPTLMFPLSHSIPCSVALVSVDVLTFGTYFVLLRPMLQQLGPCMANRVVIASPRRNRVVNCAAVGKR
jgi:hypothetical protein